MMSKEVVDEYKKYLIESISVCDIIERPYVDSLGKEHGIFLLKGGKFETEYQSRLYIEKSGDAINADDSIRIDVLGEVISEIFRKYMLGEPISEKAKKIIEGAIL